MSIKLVLPTKNYKTEIMNYKQEFIENNDSMDGTSGLVSAKNFEEWHQIVILNSNEETSNKEFVPATSYLAVSTDDERLIGMIQIRHRLNAFLLSKGGHIGYSVRKSERKKGYATEILSLALKKCEKLEIKKILLTCNKNNSASAKTIVKNGGVLENEFSQENQIIQRYWIKLN